MSKRSAYLEHVKMTPEKLQSIVESFLTSRAQYEGLLSSAYSDQPSTLGTAISTSPTATIDTLMAWYDTLPLKQKVKFWMMSLDFITISTPLGTPSREPS